MSHTVDTKTKRREDKNPSLPWPEETESAEPKEARGGFNDPAFASNKTLPVHRWVPWIAGFSSDFVRGALSTFLSSPATVLDPFAGVGTTLVEAVGHGHDAIGFEINPYAALASRIKANAHLLPLDELITASFKFKEFYSERTSNGYVPRSKAPPGFKTRSPFYSALVLRKVLIVQDFVSSIENESLRDLFKLAFASTMVRYSNYSYEPSLGRRVAAGKQEIGDFPVAEEILKKLGEIIEDVTRLRDRIPAIRPLAKVINESFFACARHVEPDSIDLIITSPPYLNNYHYNRNTRPQLYWLGFVSGPGDFVPLENSNFGKFWQTVREQEHLDLRVNLPGSDLQDRVDALRGLNAEKGIYGGNGWANYAAAYFNDCERFALGMKHALRPGGSALVVIGNSILQGMLFPTDLYLGKIAESVGLELIGIDIPRATRVGNSIIQSDVRVTKAEDKHQLYEAVVELKKPSSKS